MNLKPSLRYVVFKRNLAIFVEITERGENIVFMKIVLSNIE